MEHTFHFRKWLNCGCLLLFISVVEHHAGIFGGRSFVEIQPAEHLKESPIYLVYLHRCILCPVIIVLIKPANMSFWVAAAGAADQDIGFGDVWFTIFGYTGSMDSKHSH